METAAARYADNLEDTMDGDAAAEEFQPALTFKDQHWVPRSAADALRQSRLAAAALFLALFAWNAFIWLVVLGDPAWPVHFSVALIQTAIFVLLKRKTTIRRRLLVLTEFTIFGLSAAHLSYIQSRGMIYFGQLEDSLELQAAIKNGLISAILIVFAYAMLIPNTWKSATWIVLVLSAAPVITTIAVMRTHPELREFARQTDVVRQAGVNFVLIAIAAMLSLYGVHVLNTLRKEIFEARRLNLYQLGECLGSGGMGDVYAAEHRLLKRPCAVKLIRKDVAGKRNVQARFESEVQSAARLSHPNIVEIYDYGHTENGTFYFVMERLNGLNLEDLIKNFGPIPANRLIYLLTQICAGLGEAHAVGLVHRDLKPANIFSARIGRRWDIAKILDFGLVKDVARIHQDLTIIGEISGSPLYMSPEQAAGAKDIDCRADIYVLGAVAYYCLTGQPPFKRDGMIATLLAHSNDTVTPPSQLQQDVPLDLEHVILRCLEKHRDQRYENVEDLRDALTACQIDTHWCVDQATNWWSENSVAIDEVLASPRRMRRERELAT